MPDQLGAFADAARVREEQLVQRLATSVELDRSFEGILRGAHQHNVQSRARLDALESEIRQAAASWPALNTPAGARQFQAYLAGKTREIHKIVSDASADSQQRAAQVQALTGRYPAGGARQGGGSGGPLPQEPPPPLNDFTRVEQFIYKEMMKNAQSSQIIQMRKDWHSISPVRMERALRQFHDMVEINGPWDHKPIIRDLLGRYQSDELFLWEPGTNREVYYDIWSNIHYGFEGRAAGLPRSVLDQAHQLSSSGATDYGDILSVRKGMDLFSKYGTSMTFEQFDQEVRTFIDELQAAQEAGFDVPQVRRAHW